VVSLFVAIFIKYIILNITMSTHTLERGLIVYAFGADPENPVNQALAEHAMTTYRHYGDGLLVVAQDEVAQNLEGQLPSEHLVAVGANHEGDYLNTADIGVEGLLALASKDRVLVGAQSIHAIRATIWTRSLAKAIGITDVSRASDLPKGYAPTDPQSHVRSQGSFLPREVVAMAATPLVLPKAKRRLLGDLATQPLRWQKD